ncbi:MAG: hypothetical protein ACQER4_04625 [Bacteroidota bacterium]
MNTVSPFVLWTLLLVTPIVWVACDTQIDPILESDDRYIYSLHGLLDATADTQWVRVMPFRENFRPENEPLDASVTLKHLESGQETTLRDSLFRFGEFEVWNFWTDEPMQPGDTYRLEAHRSDGKSSETLLTFPDPFPRPLVELGEVVEEEQDILFDQITLEGIEQPAYIFLYFELIIDQQGIFDDYNAFVAGERYFRFTVTEEAERTATPGKWRLTIDRRALELDFAYYLESMMPFPLTASNLWDYVSIGHGQVEVIVAGPEWVPFDNLSLEEMELPDGISNVDRGLGFVAGVLSTTVPYDTCYLPNSRTPTPCPAEPTMQPASITKVVYDH